MKIVTAWWIVNCFHRYFCPVYCRRWWMFLLINYTSGHNNLTLSCEVSTETHYFFHNICSICWIKVDLCCFCPYRNSDFSFTHLNRDSAFNRVWSLIESKVFLCVGLYANIVTAWWFYCIENGNVFCDFYLGKFFLSVQKQLLFIKWSSKYFLTATSKPRTIYLQCNLC